MHLDFEEAASKEYLLTNGIGGYSSSSIAGANTRRYHGLLVASLFPPTDRLVLVSKIEETLVANGVCYELSSNQYPGSVHPRGYSYIENYNCNTENATFNYNVAGYALEKKIEMVQGENTVMLSYTNRSKEAVELLLMPLLVYRDYHTLFYQDEQFDFYEEGLADDYFKVYAKYQAHPLYLKFTKGNWKGEHDWYKKIQYRQEEARGFDFQEDAISIGRVAVSLAANETIQLIFSTDEINEIPEKAAKEITDTNSYPAFVNDLIKSSRQFVVHRKSTGGSTIIAGYHWFTDWGRDTMIALRGISIATGKKEEAKSILKTFLSALSEGMLPNRFPDYTGEAVEYNTIDATLWLFVTLYEYHQKFADVTFIKGALPQLKEVIDWHIKGTRFNIHLTPEGLLYGGETGFQLTWMDARVDDFVVTPRIGCPVEINALWYNTLCIYQYFNKAVSGKELDEINPLIKKCKQSFLQFFVNQNDYLNDVVIPGVYVDDSIRPNQVYAVSLPFSPLNTVYQKKVLESVTEHLLTPFGLRTLNTANAQFKPVYEGNAWHRDHAYHQGTVWPFLWGEWALAYLKQNDFSSKACKYIWEQSIELRDHFYDAGCAFAIAEIFDGLQPITGKGCVQQAWSVAMLLAVFLNKDFDWSLITA
ncbi:MAG: amylo-alpha-1,6-glucosidase [Chitinophagaceae bacterium]